MLTNAGMVELADTQDLGSCAERCTGSTPATRTKIAVSTFVETAILLHLNIKINNDIIITLNLKGLFL